MIALALILCAAIASMGAVIIVKPALAHDLTRIAGRGGGIESADFAAHSRFNHPQRGDCNADSRLGSTSPNDRLVAGATADRPNALRSSGVRVRHRLDLRDSLNQAKSATEKARAREILLEHLCFLLPSPPNRQLSLNPAQCQRSAPPSGPLIPPPRSTPTSRSGTNYLLKSQTASHQREAGKNCIGKGLRGRLFATRALALRSVNVYPNQIPFASASAARRFETASRSSARSLLSRVPTTSRRTSLDCRPC